MGETAENNDRDQLPFAQHHAFIIGIDAYEKVSRLKTAVADAEQLAAVLSTQQHFLVHPPLLNPTGADIRTLLQQTLPTEVEKDDRVFFYFAGHGIAADGDDGPAGYVVPADADPTDVTTFVPMADLQAAFDALPCRHLLLVLDCCFSGAFKWSSQYRDIVCVMPKRIYKERFDRFIEDPAWQVITSAAYDQKALDVLEGKPIGDRGVVTAAAQTQHSPFAQALFDGLSGKADAQTDPNGEGDGVITATELYSYIRDQVEPDTIEAGQKLRQTPSFFPLKKHDKGEFIFLKPNHRLNLPPIPKRSPYKGLASFDEADRDLFYGRDDVIKELRAKAMHNRLLVVSGASGTGKSSVVKAGLLPVLRSEGLRMLPVMRPGAHPLAELEKVLAETEAAPREGADSSGSTGPGSILLIDQFEEVITRCADPDQRQAFDSRLSQLLEDGRIHRLILTVRSDFEPQLNSGAMKAEWAAGHCTVPPFSLEDLKEAIVLPTTQEVLIFDPPELVDEIIDDVVQSPGALPLLSFTLGELYEAYRSSGRQDRALTKEDYDRLGGVMGALRTKADSLYESMAAPEQATMRKIMLRMVSVEGDLASKRVPMADLVYSEVEKPLVDRVVEQLVDARLVMKGRDYIEPAHDALVRAWQALHDWVFEVGKDKLILGTKLNAAANEFVDKGDKGLLWNSNPNLPVLQQEVKKPGQWFNAKEIAFVNASYQRKINKTRWTVGITALVMVALATATVYSIRQNSLARAELQRSTALRISAEAGEIITTDLPLPGGPERALQQVLAASVLVDPSREAGWLQSLVVRPAAPPAEVLGSMLIAEMALDSGVKLVADGLNFTIRSVALSVNGRYVVLGGVDGNNGVVRRWDAERGTVTSLLEEPGESVYGVASSSDGTNIAAGGRGGDIWVWNNPQDSPRRIDIDQSAFTGSVAFSPDGQRIAVGGQSGELLNANTLERIAAFDVFTSITSVAFSGDGTRIAMATGAPASNMWGYLEVLTVDGTSLGRFGEAGPMDDGFKGPPHYNSVAINHDGSRIASAGVPNGEDPRDVRLWDYPAPTVQSGQRLEGLTEPRSVAFSPDGARLVAGGADGKIVVWDATTGNNVNESVSAQRNVLAVAFSADGGQVVSGGEDGILRLWEPMMPLPSETTVACGPGRATQDDPSNNARSPDGSLIARGGPARGNEVSGQGGTLELLNADGQPLSGPIDGHVRPTGTEADSMFTDDAEREGRVRTDYVSCASFSEDGKKVVSLSTNGTIQIWDVESDSLVAGDSLEGQRFVLSRYGGFIVVGNDSAVRLYDNTESLKPIGSSLTSSADDWSSIYQTVRSWPGLQAGRATLCSRLTRNMSRARWQEWISSEVDYVVQCPELPVPD